MLVCLLYKWRLSGVDWREIIIWIDLAIIPLLILTMFIMSGYYAQPELLLPCFTSNISPKPYSPRKKNLTSIPIANSQRPRNKWQQTLVKSHSKWTFLGPHKLEHGCPSHSVALVHFYQEYHCQACCEARMYKIFYIKNLCQWQQQQEILCKPVLPCEWNDVLIIDGSPKCCQ